MPPIYLGYSPLHMLSQKYILVYIGDAVQPCIARWTEPNMSKQLAQCCLRSEVTQQTYRHLLHRFGFRQSARPDIREEKPQKQGIWAYISSSDSFDIMVAIHRNAKPNKQGLVGTFPKTEPMQEVSVHPLVCSEKLRS